MNMDTSSTIFTKSSQLLGFADDLDIMGRNMEAVKEKFVALDRKSIDLGLGVNDMKTEYMIISSSNRQHDQNVTIGTHTFKVPSSNLKPELQEQRISCLVIFVFWLHTSCTTNSFQYRMYFLVDVQLVRCTTNSLQIRILYLACFATYSLQINILIH